MIEVKKPLIISSLIMFLSTVILSGVIALLKSDTAGETIQIIVLAAVFSFAVVFTFCFETAYGTLDYDNHYHIYRFLLVYEISLILSLSFSFVDKTGWLFVCMSIAMALFSNSITGLTSVSGMIILSTMLSTEGNIVTIAVYLIACVLSIVVFKNIDENFNVSFSIIISMLSLLILETAGFIFLENKELNAEQFIMPIVNIAINSIVLFWSLKYFNEYVVNPFRTKYLELNDQEYKELIKLKERDKTEYFRSIHTAYLAERMARACECDVNVTKNLAYYHRIKKAFSYTQNDIKRFVKENGFPPDAARAVVEFSDKNAPLVKKEASIVFLSDKLISSIMTLFEKDREINVNYEELIDTMMDKSYVKETLKDSDLTRKDYRAIKEIMKKETLYYDFLR